MGGKKKTTTHYSYLVVQQIKHVRDDLLILLIVKRWKA